MTAFDTRIAALLRERQAAVEMQRSAREIDEIDARLAVLRGGR